MKKDIRSGLISFCCWYEEMGGQEDLSPSFLRFCWDPPLIWSGQFLTPSTLFQLLDAEFDGEDFLLANRKEIRVWPFILLNVLYSFRMNTYACQTFGSTFGWGRVSMYKWQYIWDVKHFKTWIYYDFDLRFLFFNFLLVKAEVRPQKDWL